MELSTAILQPEKRLVDPEDHVKLIDSALQGSMGMRGDFCESHSRHGHTRTSLRKAKSETRRCGSERLCAGVMLYETLLDQIATGTG